MKTAYLTPDDVLRLAAHHFDVHVEEILGASRRRPLIHYRQAAVIVARRLTAASWPEIARAFHIHHTTALHAAQRAAHEPGLRHYADDLASAIIGSGVRSAVTWHLTATCRCGWSTTLELTTAATVAELVDAYRLLERSERDHRHLEATA